MGIQEKMADMMMGGMKPEQKQEMMDTMMSKFFDGMDPGDKQKMMEGMMDKFMGAMSPEEKQSMMQNMMPKMMGTMMGEGSSSGSPMMNMMSMMMGGGMKGMAGKGQSEGQQEMPWDMCKKMMSGMNKTAELAAFATPELRGLFEEWATQIEEEILQFIQEAGDQDVGKIAKKFKLSVESINYFLTRLAGKGKINLKAEKNG